MRLNYTAGDDNDVVPALPQEIARKRGAIAHLGERFNGIEEVVGSIPSGSTIFSITYEKSVLKKRPKTDKRITNGFPPSTFGAIIIQAD